MSEKLAGGIINADTRRIGSTERAYAVGESVADPEATLGERRNIECRWHLRRLRLRASLLQH
jgi:hypothetical protein